MVMGSYENELDKIPDEELRQKPPGKIRKVFNKTKEDTSNF